MQADRSFIIPNSFPAPPRSYAGINHVVYLKNVQDSLQVKSEAELSERLDKAFRLCHSLHVSVRENFERVFFYKDGTLVSDWKVSRLGYFLLLKAEA